MTPFIVKSDCYHLESLDNIILFMLNMIVLSPCAIIQNDRIMSNMIVLSLCYNDNMTVQYDRRMINITLLHDSEKKQDDSYLLNTVILYIKMIA